MSSFEVLPDEEVIMPPPCGGEIPSFFKLVMDMLGKLSNGVDITAVRLPAVFCYPLSLLEYLCMKRFRGMTVLADYEKLDHGLQKTLLVAKWFLASVTPEDFGKKPWNPTLGESFVAKSSDGTVYLSEQVSHHPPISAFHFQNDAYRLKYYGHTQLTAKLSGTTIVAQTIGFTRLVIGDDEYKLTHLTPTLNARFALLGSNRNEYAGEVTIDGPDGTTVKLEFREHSMFNSHAFNGVRGEVYVAHQKKSIAELDGHWNSTVKIQERKGCDPLDLPFAPDGVLHDFAAVDKVHIRELRHDVQKKRSSRLVWAEPNKELLAGDFDAATVEKTKIEDAMRAEREAMEAEGEELELKLFDEFPDLPKYRVKTQFLEMALSASAGGADDEEGSTEDDKGEKSKKKKKKHKRK